EGQRRSRKLDQAAGFLLAEPVQQHEDQGLLEEVVAECGESLTPEQRRKTSRRHQGRKHGSPAVRFPFSRPDFRRPAETWRCGFPRRATPAGDRIVAISPVRPQISRAFSGRNRGGARSLFRLAPGGWLSLRQTPCQKLAARAAEPPRAALGYAEMRLECH